MKSIHSSIIPFLLLLLIVTGCENKTQEVRSKSPDGNNELIVKGFKAGIDPWKLEIIQVKEGKTLPSNATIPEFHSGDLNNENILIQWENDKKCNIKLIEQDGVTRDVLVEF